MLCSLNRLSLPIFLTSYNIQFSTKARNLAVIFDSEFLEQNSFIMLAIYLVNSRFDYSNSLLYSYEKKDVTHFQRVQNALAALSLGPPASGCVTITLILSQDFVGNPELHQTATIGCVQDYL